MRTTSYSLFFLFVAFLNPVCKEGASSPTSSSLATPVEISLKRGNTYLFRKEQLTIEFLQTPFEDGRCPSDVICVWAGRATIHLRITTPLETASDVPLSIPGLVQTPYNSASRDTLGYRFVLRQLDPYPSQSNPQSRKYEALLRVQRLE